MRVAALLLLIASAVGTPDELSDDGSVVMTNGNATFVVRLRPRNAEALESVVRAAALGDTDGARAALLALRERLELKIARVRAAGRADKAEKAAAELAFVNSKALAAARYGAALAAHYAGDGANASAAELRAVAWAAPGAPPRDASPRAARPGHEVATWVRARAPESAVAAAANGSAEPVPFPVFMKFHKVGSATVSRTLRCLSFAEPSRLPDAWRRPLRRNATARAARDAAAGGAAPKFRCGNSAWEHEIVLIYKRRGLHGLGGCLAAGFSPRLVTVLRDPFERVLSAVRPSSLSAARARSRTRRRPSSQHSRARARGVPFHALPALSGLLLPRRRALGRRALPGAARRRPPRALQRERPRGVCARRAHHAVGDDAETPSPLKVRGELIIAAGGLYEYLQALGGEDGGGARGYTYYHALHTFDGADVAAAKAALARDFAVVGVTEVMSGFLALLALEMRWPVRALCYVDFHRNAARPRRADFGADVVAALDAALAQEREVYDHARALYDAHARRLGARFDAAHAEFVAAQTGNASATNRTCYDVKYEQFESVVDLPEGVLSSVEKRNCEPSKPEGKKDRRGGDRANATAAGVRLRKRPRQRSRAASFDPRHRR